MRLKKGFTLAEVLIVLMVIGAIATMTIPSMMRGVTDTQWKTAYKKAFNTIANLCAMQRITGELPSKADAKGVGVMFRALQTNLSVKDYAKSTGDYGGEDVYGAADMVSGVYYEIGEGDDGKKYGNKSATGVVDLGIIEEKSAWINTEDNFSYLVVKGTGTIKDEGGTSSPLVQCGTKETINLQTTTQNAFGASCVVIVVDINGIGTGPNLVEPQITNNITKVDGLQPLSGDRYYIYIGLDGATAGNKRESVMGRIVADMK